MHYQEPKHVLLRIELISLFCEINCWKNTTVMSNKMLITRNHDKHQHLHDMYIHIIYSKVTDYILFLYVCQSPLAGTNLDGNIVEFG